MNETGRLKQLLEKVPVKQGKQSYNSEGPT